ncbi:type I restriction-modification system subunit M [Fluviispira multicolorata]|uniref:site-specific DNA-methyltransferase (adenine-specific) n=1 Tax=Fluviispira multicolorata TaxID=2654512 RepID=A0A833JDX5_9BACT|nr:type I restriction-modification system subunit M [Fluviispira multicolorata]KAB8029216.1 type I restriction-modification system subunit M [Fluviispira multicolorata]
MKEVKYVTQEEINSILWKACDTFRGILNSATYMNYLLPMLFLKYISDSWELKYEDTEEDTLSEINFKKNRLKLERFILPNKCHFNDIYDQRNTKEIGKIINNVFHKVEEANKEKLTGVFRNIDFNSEALLGQSKERNLRLKNLLEDFNSPKLNLRQCLIGNQDIIGNAYEYLIYKFAAGAGQKAGEFYTPSEVSELIAQLIDLKEGETICDPTCGSGSLLIKCANQLVKKGIYNFHLYGQEINGQTYALAKMNMFLHNVVHAHIEWCDSIRNPKLVKNNKIMKFDVLVANPPFSLEKWGIEQASTDIYNRFHRGLPPKSKGDYAFISHMIESMNEKSGRIAMIVSHGVLFRGSTEKKIRRKLIEENLLDAVIGLPDNLFYGTIIPAVILIFKKNKSNSSILFIDASFEFNSEKKKNALRQKDIEKILIAYEKRETIKGFSYNASFSEIEENDFNLNISHFVNNSKDTCEIDIISIQHEINKLEKECAGAHSAMNRQLIELGFKL